MTAEQLRLAATRERKIPWKEWGPYLSERQWGTVREDYSDNGDAWQYSSHDQARARSRAYRSRYHADHPYVFRVGGQEFRVASGWTGVVARLMHFFATVKPDELLERGKLAYAQPAAGSKR